MDFYQNVINLAPIHKQGPAFAKSRKLSEAISEYRSSIDGNLDQEEIKQIIVDAWCLMFAYERTINIIPADKREAEFEKASRIFDAIFADIFRMESGIKIVAFEGKPYEPNRPVQAVNLDDFSGNKPLIVSETLEPALIKNGKVLHFAKVSLVELEFPQPTIK